MTEGITELQTEGHCRLSKAPRLKNIIADYMAKGGCVLFVVQKLCVEII